jgi:hypothetical protein
MRNKIRYNEQEKNWKEKKEKCQRKEIIIDELQALEGRTMIVLERRGQHELVMNPLFNCPPRQKTNCVLTLK